MALKFVFMVLPETHLLDLAGPEQVINAAIGQGADFEIHYCSVQKSITTSAGLTIAKLPLYHTVQLSPGDYLIVAGAYTGYLLSDEFANQHHLFNWIKKAQQHGVNICSICTGAFVLAYTGVLDGAPCTTHWQLTGKLQSRFKQLQVQPNVLYVKHGNVYTSAGIVSGIDMMLAIVEEIKGPYFAHKIARELVVYNRRNAQHTQHSEFLNYRNHLHQGIHQVQDWLHQNLHKKTNLHALAGIANMSPRNFTRVFKKETGVTVNEYVTTLRKEKIGELLKKPDLSRRQIAQHCGLKSERQVHRLMQLN